MADCVAEVGCCRLGLRGGRFALRCAEGAVPGITQHTLTTQLRELEADGLRCKIFAEVPPRVEYAITPAARAPKSVIDAVFTCWRNHERAALGSEHRGEQPTRLRGACLNRPMCHRFCHLQKTPRNGGLRSSGTERRARHLSAAHQKEGPDRASKTRTGDEQAAPPCPCSDVLAMREKS